MRSVLALLLLALAAGCGTQSPPPPPPAAATTQSEFNPTDAAWLELMIPMDEQFLGILALAPTHSANPAVRRLAAELTTAHRTELKQLVALRNQAGLPAGNPHQGHDMPGMMTQEEIVALSNLRGAPFDQILVREVKDHLAQSTLVTKSVKAAGRAPGVRKLATQIEQTRLEQNSIV
ncbi:DUF305 domain-containing protein [Kribbella sp. NPDC051952]|uniref:DUF305 domain-containing protein n=1 Tax=Kribbella sp. NPDC051952 TaxID=3154851 RepID=UPI00341D9502